MNKIAQVFTKGKVFIPFITGGDPDLATTEKLLYALYESGAGLIEIGIPFSDPIAEGPVIEASAERALKAGCTVDKLFEMIARVRDDIKVPLVFMTYYNPIFAYGIEKFVDKCAVCGIDGLIVPDLPFEEQDELQSPLKARGLTLISLIASTSEGRVRDIAADAEGFVYCVSSLGVTGTRDDLGGAAAQMVANVRAITKTPCAVGFGISSPEQAREVVAYADGVIIGSAIVQIIAKHGSESVEPVRQFAAAVQVAIL